MSTLVVVDMQTRYGASQHDWLIENVSREIRAAMDRSHAIVFLEYMSGHADDMSGAVAMVDATDRRLTELVGRYAKAIVAHKPGKDGSGQVAAVAAWMNDQHSDRGHRYDDEIRVVGVQTGVCVAATVNGLSARMPDTRIILVGDACNDAGYGKGPNDIGQDGIEAAGNVAILKADAA